MPCALSPGCDVESLRRAVRWLWYGALVMLPITSPIAWGGSGGSIRPPSIVIAGLALPLVFWLYRGELLKHRPLIAVMVATAWSIVVGGVTTWLVEHPVNVWTQKLPAMYVWQALAMLAGVGFYVVAVFQLQNAKDLENSLPFIAAGVLIAVLLATLQVFTADSSSFLRQAVFSITALFSSAYDVGTGQVVTHRGIGLAYEPSYLASFLLVLMPVAIIGVLYTSRKWLSTALLLLIIWGVLMSGSRFGLALCCAMSCCALGFLMFGDLGRLAKLMLAFASVSLVCVGLSIAMKQYDTRVAYAGLANQWFGSDQIQVDEDATDRFREWLFKSSFETRYVAAIGGFKMCAHQPILGCGLGSSIVWLPHLVPEWALRSSEVRYWIEPDAHLQDRPKQYALTIRVLAELGIVGFAVWAFALLSHVPWRASMRWRLIGLWAVVLLALDGLLIASLARPWPWLLLAALAIRDWRHPEPALNIEVKL